MPTIGHYATLRNLLLEMERDLQITGLSDIDKRVISTLVLVDEGKRNGASSMISEHMHLPHRSRRLSLYRSFQTLINMGLINKVGSPRSGLYQLASS